MFYDTLSLSSTNTQLYAELNVRAIGLEKLIKNFFERNPGKAFTPPEVRKRIKKRYPITSVRRAMSDLTDEGVLVKSEVQRLGDYDVPNYTWQLNIKGAA